VERERDRKDVARGEDDRDPPTFESTDEVRGAQVEATVRIRERSVDIGHDGAPSVSP